MPEQDRYYRGIFLAPGRALATGTERADLCALRSRSIIIIIATWMMGGYTEHRAPGTCIPARLPQSYRNRSQKTQRHGTNETVRRVTRRRLAVQSEPTTNAARGAFSRAAATAAGGVGAHRSVARRRAGRPPAGGRAAHDQISIGTPREKPTLTIPSSNSAEPTTVTSSW